MEIGAAGALSLYNYQTALSSGGSTPAALQALAQSYSQVSSGSSLFGTDGLSALVGTDQAIAALTQGIYTASAANGSPSTNDLSSVTQGTTDSAAISSLLSSLSNSSDSSSGLLGFDTALNANTTAALLAYQYQSATSTSSNDTASQLSTAQESQYKTTLNLLA